MNIILFLTFNILMLPSTYIEIMFDSKYYYNITGNTSKFVELIIELMFFYISLYIIKMKMNN